MRSLSGLVRLSLLLSATNLVLAQSSEHRQAYLALVFHVRPAEASKFVQSNRQYSAALAAHNVSDPLLHWTTYSAPDTYSYLWFYPIGHLNDIEKLSDTESQLGRRIEAEHWDVGADLHEAVDHTEEFVIRDEPSLSRLPADQQAWMHELCEFNLYYTSGGYGGSDSEVRRLWTEYRGAFSDAGSRSYYRVLRVLIGLERPLWVVQRCGTSWQQISDDRQAEVKQTGTIGAQSQRSFLALVRKVEVWRYEFDEAMSYAPASKIQK